MRKAKKLIFVCLMAVLALATFMFAGCGGEKNISVIARNSGSGTRDAFESIVKNADGEKLKDVGIVKGALEQDKTSTVISLVSETKTAIGYVSLGSVDASVKVLKVGGVEANANTVLDGSYKMQRPFVIMTNKAKTESNALTPATTDFVKFLKSTQAQAVVAAEGYVKQEEGAVAYTASAEALSGSIVIKGSTSVDPLMDKLIAKYKEINGAKVDGVEFNKDCQGSSYGIQAAKDDTQGNVIGLNSSSVKSADAASLSYFNISLDAIAVIVNKDNDIDNITIEQLFDIYTGAIVKFSEIK